MPKKIQYKTSDLKNIYIFEQDQGYKSSITSAIQSSQVISAKIMHAKSSKARFSYFIELQYGQKDQTFSFIEL